MVAGTLARLQRSGYILSDTGRLAMTGPVQTLFTMSPANSWPHTSDKVHFATRCYFPQQLTEHREVRLVL